MALYVTVSEGRTPATATPILATRDPEVLKVLGTALSQRLTPVRISPDKSADFKAINASEQADGPP